MASAMLTVYPTTCLSLDVLVTLHLILYHPTQHRPCKPPLALGPAAPARSSHAGRRTYIPVQPHPPRCEVVCASRVVPSCMHQRANRMMVGALGCAGPHGPQQPLCFCVVQRCETALPLADSSCRIAAPTTPPGHPASRPTHAASTPSRCMSLQQAHNIHAHAHTRNCTPPLPSLSPPPRPRVGPHHSAAATPAGLATGLESAAAAGPSPAPAPAVGAPGPVLNLRTFAPYCCAVLNSFVSASRFTSLEGLTV